MYYIIMIHIELYIQMNATINPLLSRIGITWLSLVNNPPRTSIRLIN